MRTIENEILQLAEEIYSGKCSYSKTVNRLKSLEQKYGPIERDIAYPDYPNSVANSYLDELIGRVRVGLYSKELLLDMAKAADTIYATQLSKSNVKKPVIVGIAITAVIIIAVIIALGLGE